jgi:FixJ family two-component response regulator
MRIGGGEDTSSDDASSDDGYSKRASVMRNWRLNMIFNATVSGSSSSMLSATPTVFVVDAEPAVGKSLEPLIRGAGWRTKDFASAEEFVTLPRMRVPSCLVLEIYPPGLSNPELQRLVGDRMEMPVILLSCHSEAPMIVQAMKAGAFDYFIKPFDLQALIHSIESALARSHAALWQGAELQGLRDCYESLSPREREVMGLVVAGRLNKVIGGELGISEITVKQHRGRLMRKMGATSLPDLVHMAAKLGLTSVPKKRLALEHASHSPISKNNFLPRNPADEAHPVSKAGAL